MPQSRRIRVLLAEDHRLFAESLQLILRAQRSVSAVHLAHSGRELLESPHLPKVDVIILDLRLPDINGLDCAGELRAKFPGLKFLVMTGQPSHAAVARALQVGVEGFITKSCDTAELQRALRTVAKGGNYYDASAEALRQEVDSGYLGTPLSNRELAILREVARGLTSREIAETLNIRPRTVEKHRQNIRVKTRLNRSVQLCVHAHVQGMV
jgi:two-component system, NarL family, nitrate/nitrite response regulator NarL|uniref:response regulator transcription factor n=1 Tax=Cephaloticoccus sp. TaxID=1985742 RepID=UPI00404AD6EB